MRKAIIQLKPNILVRKIQKGIYDSVLRIEGRELLKLDFERTTKLVITDLILKPGRHLEDVEFPSGVDILNVLKVEGERYTVLMRAKAPGKKFTGLFKMFDLNVIYDVPFSATSELIVFSAMGENEPLNKLIKLLKLLGEVEKVSFTRATFSEHEILKVLTDKQRDILIEAKKRGYYQYPRRINTEELSKRMGISKATTVEHLRKAEIRLMSNLLEGY